MQYCKLFHEYFTCLRLVKYHPYYFYLYIYFLVYGNLDHVILLAAGADVRLCSTSAIVRSTTACLDAVRPLPLYCGRFCSTAAALRTTAATLALLRLRVRLCSEYVPQRSALMSHHII